MKLSLITTTCRPNPRLDLMARTLAASLRIAPGVTLEWQVIDQGLLARDMGGDAGPGARTERWQAMATPFDDMLDNGNAGANARVTLACRAVPGASFLTPAKLRNAALEYATGDYVVFLDDCTVVTKNFLGTAAACAVEGHGWRCKTKTLHDLAIPEDGKLRHGDHHDRLRIVPYSTVGGVAWGAPRAALEKIGGFDPSYDGELKHNQLEAILRLSRAGVTFVTTGRAVAITLRRTHTELAGREAYAGKRNLALFNELLADRGNTVRLDQRHALDAALVPGDGFGDDETPIADLEEPGAVPGADRPDPAVPLPGLPPEMDKTAPVVGSLVSRPPGVPAAVAPASPAQPRARPGGGKRRPSHFDTRHTQAALIAQQGKSVVTQDELDKFANGEPMSPEPADGDPMLDALDDDDDLEAFS